jgi:hypothetical protein
MVTVSKGCAGYSPALPTRNDNLCVYAGDPRERAGDGHFNPHGGEVDQGKTTGIVKVTVLAEEPLLASDRTKPKSFIREGFGICDKVAERRCFRMLEVIGGPDRDRTDDLFHAMIWVEG